MEEAKKKARRGRQEVRRHRRPGRTAADRRLAEVRARARSTAKVARLGEGQRRRHAPASSTPATTVALLLDRTNFYAEQGGQVGDTGVDPHADGRDFEVEDTQRLGDAVLHVGRVARRRARRSATRSTLDADHDRRIDIMRNHTATHLLNLALRAGARRARRAEGLAGRCREDAVRLHPRQAADGRADRARSSGWSTSRSTPTCR